MPLELVIFDLAGTTVKDNRDVHRALIAALADEQVHVTEDDANDVMGIPKPVAIGKLLSEKYKGNRLIDEKWISEIHRSFKNHMLSFYESSPLVGEKPGVSKLFASLKERGILVGIDTGFDRDITNALLKRLKWESNDLIDISITSDEVLRGRPFPDMIFKTMALTGVSNPAFVAKVGDTVSDLEEGHAAGCRWVIGVTDGAFTREQLTRGPFTHLVDEVTEVLDILLKEDSYHE